VLISSKYAGTCTVCSKPILVGDRISWTKGVREVSHATCSAEGKELAAKLAPSHAATADVDLPCPEGLEYLPFQKAGIAYVLAKFVEGKTGALIGDEPGLGKTIQAIGVVNASPEIKSVLVVCPASLKLNWRNEFRKWSVRTDFGMAPTSLDPAHPNCVTIVNYDILKKLPATFSADLIVIDEAQYIKNPKSQRSKLLKTIAKRCKRKLLLTGTPITNRPVELFPLLSLVDPEEWDPAGLNKQAIVDAGEGAGFFKFAKRYCNAQKRYMGRKSFWDFSGSSNLVELQERLRLTCMVRRLKTDVLTELPPKRRQTIVLPKNGSSVDVDAELEAWGDPGDLYESDVTQLRSKLAFTEISSARRKLAVSKVLAVVAHVRDALESSDKIILFAHHKEVIAELMTELTEFNPVRIVGESSQIERQDAVEQFQSNPAVRLIIGSIGAMGVGLTLTVSSHVVFAELSWVPAEMNQAEDRAHRITQRNSVLVQHLVVEGSLDARMIELLTTKQAVADMALDTETMQDVSDRANAPGRKSVTDVARELGLSESEYIAERFQVSRRLQFLSARCDGALTEDGQGFNSTDSYAGKRLAKVVELTPNQFLYARKMLVKYHRQLKLGGIL